MHVSRCTLKTYSFSAFSVACYKSYDRFLYCCFFFAIRSFSWVFFKLLACGHRSRLFWLVWMRGVLGYRGWNVFLIQRHQHCTTISKETELKLWVFPASRYHESLQKSTNRETTRVSTLPSLYTYSVGVQIYSFMAPLSAVSSARHQCNILEVCFFSLS